MVDFVPTREQARWRDIAREFTATTIKSDVLRRDRLPSAEERIPWDWIRKASECGLRTLHIPKRFGGAEADIMTLCLVGEELAVGDLGFAVIMDHASETAFDACRLASEILGGAAIMYDHPVEKYLRDAASFLHSDGTNQLCLLRAVRGMAAQDPACLYGF